ncbi:hypothetical protein CEP62_018775 [Raoultella planticola]|nr:hypothetical protein CEP62_018775 [Raoultella planticola]
MSAVITFSFVCVKITTCWFKYKIDYIFITNRNKWYTRHTSSCMQPWLRALAPVSAWDSLSGRMTLFGASASAGQNG